MVKIKSVSHYAVSTITEFSRGLHREEIYWELRLEYLHCRFKIRHFFVLQNPKHVYVLFVPILKSFKHPN